MIAEGLWTSDGKTPAATVSARLYSDIKNNGDKSPFEKAPKPPSVNAGFSFINCAQKVLEEFGGKKPMHYKEITEKALLKGWLVTGGKTPDATMYAQVITEIKRQQKRGERPCFVQHGRGYIALSQWINGSKPNGFRLCAQLFRYSGNYPGIPVDSSGKDVQSNY